MRGSAQPQTSTGGQASEEVNLSQVKSDPALSFLKFDLEFAVSFPSVVMMT
jgi:hypothetical protein